ncbi:hypothetical protein [Winogradskyella aquimaris]|uniref:Por secretion system C-terminal sorting domain-containing protein n=1 Tax=Winogradskyella aquimaris TaxID=864074 RepID=A0ABU5EJI4_9FLAO|nr:hypothetical protein [Winogradskyella aquimaris]MDY2586403.1 hypothetical protein [Winogradskyella aquimaris]
MKRLIRNIMVVAVMLGTSTGYANQTLKETPTFKYINEGHMLTVINASGDIIYSGRIKQSGSLDRLFDFSQLKDGNYTVEISKDFEIEVIDLEVKDNNVKLFTETEEKVFKPVFRTENSMLIVSKIALDTKEMDVELYFEDELIHKETVKGDDILNRVYRLDRTLNGNYTAVIRCNGRVYIKDFRI